MTPEEMQDEILSLQSRLTDAETERDTLRETNNQLTADIERVRKKNQEYFDRLTQQYTPQYNPNNPQENPQDDIPSCEEFATTLKI